MSTAELVVRDIYLHGEMGELFGKHFRIAVSSLKEVAQALGAQIKGFRQYIALNERFFHVTVKGLPGLGGIELGPEQVDFRLGKGEIHILPVLQGSKKAGIGKLIAGVLIAAVAFFALPATMAIGGFAISSSSIAMFGLGLALTGISQLLTPKPKKKGPEPKSNSFIMDGPTNITGQGGPVPYIYGKTRVGSVLISAGVSNVDIPIG